MKAPTSICVPGLTRIDQLEMGQDLDASVVKFQDEALPPGTHGELFSVAIIAATIIGIRGLAAWLLDHGDGYGQPAAAITSAVTLVSLRTIRPS